MRYFAPVIFWCLKFALAANTNAVFLAERMPRVRIDPTNPDFIPGLHSPPQSARYEKFASDVRCNETPMWKGKVTGMPGCRDKCTDDERCEFYAYWTQRKYCEIYSSCKSQSPDGSNSIMLYARIDECKVLIKDGSGTMYQMIVAEFPTEIVRPFAPRKNVHCTCVSRNWMICVIYVRPESEEELAINSRLTRNDPRNLKPFFNAYPSIPGQEPSPVCLEYDDRAAANKVFAEIEIYHPTRCIDLDVCKKGTPGGVCPAEGTEFTSGEAVFIMREDMALATSGKPVRCISVVGLRKMVTFQRKELTQQQSYIYKDSFGREADRSPDNPLIVGVDYKMYFQFDAKDRAEGICQDGSQQLQILHAEEEKGEPSNAEGENQAESSGKKSKKKKKKKKGKGATINTSAEAGEEEEDLDPEARSPSAKADVDTPRALLSILPKRWHTMDEEKKAQVVEKIFTAPEYTQEIMQSPAEPSRPSSSPDVPPPANVRISPSSPSPADPPPVQPSQPSSPSDFMTPTEKPPIFRHNVVRKSYTPPNSPSLVAAPPPPSSSSPAGSPPAQPSQPSSSANAAPPTVSSPIPLKRTKGRQATKKEKTPVSPPPAEPPRPTTRQSVPSPPVSPVTMESSSQAAGASSSEAERSAPAGAARAFGLALRDPPKRAPSQGSSSGLKREEVRSQPQSAGGENWNTVRGRSKELPTPKSQGKARMPADTPADPAPKPPAARTKDRSRISISDHPMVAPATRQPASTKSDDSSSRKGTSRGTPEFRSSARATSAQSSPTPGKERASQSSDRLGWSSAKHDSSKPTQLRTGREKKVEAVVMKINYVAGYGFLHYKGEDIFFNTNDIMGHDIRDMKEGDKVRCDIGPSPGSKTDRRKAYAVRVLRLEKEGSSDTGESSSSGSPPVPPAPMARSSSDRKWSEIVNPQGPSSISNIPSQSPQSQGSSSSDYIPLEPAPPAPAAAASSQSVPPQSTRPPLPSTSSSIEDRKYQALKSMMSFLNQPPAQAEALPYDKVTLKIRTGRSADPAAVARLVKSENRAPASEAEQSRPSVPEDLWFRPPTPDDSSPPRIPSPKQIFRAPEQSPPKSTIPTSVRPVSPQELWERPPTPQSPTPPSTPKSEDNQLPITMDDASSEDAARPLPNFPSSSSDPSTAVVEQRSLTANELSVIAPALNRDSSGGISSEPSSANAGPGSPSNVGPGEKSYSDASTGPSVVDPDAERRQRRKEARKAKKGVPTSFLADPDSPYNSPYQQRPPSPRVANFEQVPENESPKLSSSATDPQHQPRPPEPVVPTTNADSKHEQSGKKLISWSQYNAMNDGSLSSAAASSSSSLPLTSQNTQISFSINPAQPLPDHPSADRPPRKNYRASSPDFSGLTPNNDPRPPSEPRFQEKSSQTDEDHVSSQLKAPAFFRSGVNNFFTFIFLLMFFSYFTTLSTSDTSHDVYIEFPRD